MSETLTQPPHEAEIAARLRWQWNSMVQEVGGRTFAVDFEFDRMVREYQKGDGRSYHNLSHIGKVDEILNKYKNLARNWTALKFAGDGHDVIYVPGSDTNEAESAVYTKGIMARLEIPVPTIIEAGRIINITKDHKTTEDDIDGKLMIDADFAIFASSPEEYDEYAQGIWQEYVGSGKVPEEMFKRGRGSKIDGWLKQDRIFLVDEIKKDLEPIARQNLERERLRLAA